MNTFGAAAKLSADYFCLVSYISSDGHFSEIYLDCLVTALKSLLDVLYCRVTALDKQLNSRVIACIKLAKVPKLSFNGHAKNKMVRRRSMEELKKKQQNSGKVETSASLLLLYGHPRGNDQKQNKTGSTNGSCYLADYTAEPNIYTDITTCHI